MRITLEQARAFNAKRGHGALIVASMRYLEMADGNESLATLIAEYYQGTGREKDYTVGKVIREFWLAKQRREGAERAGKERDDGGSV